ncbi:MAG: hypothetical protein WBP90_13375 [Terracidiphilus sp.]
MANFSWHRFENGGTLGKAGSEEGTVVRDEEYSLGARITLERDCRNPPFAITCGIYGWMLHTRYFSSQFEAETQYEAMKSALAMLLEVAEQTAEIDGGRQVLMAGVSKFVEMFP